VVRKLSPQTIIFSDIGPDARWCGNEKGYAGKANWDLLDTVGFKRGIGAPPTDTLNQGNKYGKNWIPAECDVSIRPGWFYHPKEDSLVKTSEQLFEIYLKSVGRGANLILNVPPDRRGLITQYDSASLMRFKKLREESFANDLSKKGKQYFIYNKKPIPIKELNTGNSQSFQTITMIKSQSIEIAFNQPEKINCIVLKENLASGQNCAKFTIQLLNKDHDPIKEIDGTTIGHKRILTFPETEAYFINLSIGEQKGFTKIYGMETYRIDEGLVEK
jgi:alpha-L-fucosidase